MNFSVLKLTVTVLDKTDFAIVIKKVGVAKESHRYPPYSCKHPIKYTLYH